MLERWQSILQSRTTPHWRELVNAPAEMPAEWANAPDLLRLLTLTAQHAQFAEQGALPVMPQLLQALGLTQDLLPSLVIIDPAWRHRPRDLAATARRNLRQLTGAALHGLKRLNRLEADYHLAARVLRGEARPGALGSLITLIERDGIVTPRSVARDCQLSISGAGKLLSRAARFGLVVEVSGRTSWRTYLSPQLAIEFGYVAARRGRPPFPSPMPPPSAPMWRAFDDEMAAIDDMLARFDPA